ncbi:GIY-YIG nuclease family protein, partial [Patescibacteria group bacterium]|nr:GIY-YIG nuclease family protein [Patescibacteria group bacterium]
MIKKLAIIPQKPGVYFFRDRKNSILYIGKAINLRSRVRSYFQKSASLEMAKKIMVQKAADVDYIIVDSPTEALLLESSLIKKHKPPYNINLKDDKFFVYLKVTLEEDFPRVLTVRRVEKDKNRYFGPYASATAVKNTLHLLKRIFPYKICKNPPEKLCLGYHIGKC